MLCVRIYSLLYVCEPVTLCTYVYPFFIYLWVNDICAGKFILFYIFVSPWCCVRGFIPFYIFVDPQRCARGFIPVYLFVGSRRCVDEFFPFIYLWAYGVVRVSLSLFLIIFGLKALRA